MKARHPQGDNTPTVNVSPFERIASTGVGGYLLYDSIVNNDKWRWVKAVGGALLLFRGVTGYCPVYGAMGKSQLPVPYKTINIRTKLTVNKGRNEVYAFWRKLENLPLFMKHLESVEKIDEKYSNWKAKFPGQVSLEWKAEIVKEREGEFLGWSSTEDATIRNAGKVEFKDALGGKGTEINVVIAYHPPLGVVGSGIAKLFNKKLEKMIRTDIQNFKSYIETGVNEKTESGITNPNVTKTSKDLKKEQKASASEEPATTSHDLLRSAAQGIAEGLEKNTGEKVFGQL